MIARNDYSRLQFLSDNACLLCPRRATQERDHVDSMVPAGEPSGLAEARLFRA